MAEVKDLLKTTFVDPRQRFVGTHITTGINGTTPLIVAGKIFLFSSSDPDPDTYLE